MKIERVYTKPNQHPVEIGYFKHPDLNIWLSGVEDKILTPDGFLEPSTGGEYKYYIRRHLHVLKLETFLEKPTAMIKLLGNHIDGDKRNNTLSNLEWATTTMNIVHAYKTGLRTDNKHGLLVDLFTGKCVSFSSLRECALYLEVNSALLTRYLRTERKCPFKFKYAIRLLGEKITLTKADVGKSDKQSPNPLIAKDELSGETKYFAFERSARKCFGLGYRAFKSCLKEGRFKSWVLERVKTYEDYCLCFKLDPCVQEKAETSRLYSLKAKLVKEAKRVIVTNHLANSSKEYSSVYEFAKQNKFGIGEINRALSTKNCWREFTFEFLE